MVVHRTIQERIVRRNAFAYCPFSVASERAYAALRGARFEALVVNDFTDPVRRHEAVEFRWTPLLRILPAAQALLTVRPHAPQGTELQLSIAYVPPDGRIGSIFDWIVGRHFAWLTVGVLLFGLQHAIHRHAARMRKERTWPFQPPPAEPR